MRETNQEYRDYLQSAEWHRKRAAVLFDLIALCAICHEQLHPKESRLHAGHRIAFEEIFGRAFKW